MKPLVLLLALLAATLSAPSFAAPPPGTKQEPAARQESQQHPSAPAAVVTRHKVRIDGREIAYEASAGTLPVQNDAGETEAEIFYVSYRVPQAKTAPQRPLFFIFNGGPGAASVWLHLGALGPKRVQMLPDGNMPAPPFKLTENASSWLDLGDLVFVDPVGTGYSRGTKPELTRKFSAVQPDIDSLQRFIRLYLTRNESWSAPLFLVGESYGTFRCAGLSEQLVEHGIALNGVILISSILNFQTIAFDYGNDLPYPLILPSYTATAWYHKKLAPELMADLDRTLAQAERWASTDYAQALERGDRLDAEGKKKVATEFARLTGLDPAFVMNRNLRIDNRDFAREILRNERRTVGFMDSRFNVENPEPAKSASFDATIATIRPPFTAAINTYLREELGYQSDQEYFTLGGGIGRWDWEAKNSYADTAENLRNAMVKNPYLKVWVASGLFDLATPHYAAEYIMAHLGIGEKLRENVTIRRYRSGHMMYLETEALAQLKKDAAQFIGSAVKR